MSLLCFSLLRNNCLAQFDAGISSTGPEAAEIRKAQEASTKVSHSNLKIGPINISFSGGITQNYNDNISLSPNNEMQDFISMPHMGVQIAWPVSSRNTYTAEMDFGVAKYWMHPELDSTTILIFPKSASDLTVYVGDVRFTIFDRIALLQDPASVPQLSNLTSFRRLTNSLGLDAEWDLNKLLLEAGYSYDTFKSLEDQFNYLDQATHNFRDRVGVRLNSQWTVGIQNSYSMTRYEQNVQNDSSSYSFGLFAETIITEYLRGSASASFQQSSYEQTGTISDTSEFSSIIYNFSLQNQLNRWLNHSIEFRRFTTAGIGSNFTELEEIDYNVNADIIRDVGSRLTFSYQWLEDSSSTTTGEKGSRFSISPSFSYSLTSATTINLSFTHTEKESNNFLNNYSQDVVSVDLNHQF